MDKNNPYGPQDESKKKTKEKRTKNGKKEEWLAISLVD